MLKKKKKKMKGEKACGIYIEKGDTEPNPVFQSKNKSSSLLGFSEAFFWFWIKVQTVGTQSDMAITPPTPRV